MKFVEITRILGIKDYKTHSIDTIEETLNIDEIRRFSPSNNHQYFDKVVTLIELKDGSKFEVLGSYKSLKGLFLQNALYI